MKRKIYSIITILFATVMLLMLASCNAGGDLSGESNQAPQSPNHNQVIAGTHPEVAPDNSKEEPENG